MAEEPSKPDANDYSRFNDIEDADSDDEIDQKEKEQVDIPISEAIFKASGLKEAGNQAFKSNNLILARESYSSGIKLIAKHLSSPAPVEESQQKEIQSLSVALNGNLSMIESKEEKWHKCISHANEVLKFDTFNVKALFRRGVAYSREGKFDEAKHDLQRCIELDPTNAACKKELAEATKLAKEKQKKEKAMYGSMFSKGSIYEDREKERIAKEKRDQEEREKEMDDWSQSKLERRSKGLPEQTFEEWKKEKDEAKKAADEIAKKQSNPNPSPKPPSIPRAPKAAPVTTDSKDDEYDDEDEKIIKETTSKGYCYFRKEQSSEVKSLIGDITPKALNGDELPPAPVNAAAATTPSSTVTSRIEGAADSNGGGISASSWNHAGTWEERDVSTAAKARLKELCLQASSEHSGFESGDTCALMEAMESMKATLAGGPADETSSSLDSLSSSLATFRGNVVAVSKCDGEAQIVIARGKKRCVYDFNVTMDIEIVVDNSWMKDTDASLAANKPKRFKGSIALHDLSPTMPVEPHVTFKKPIPSGMEKKVKAVVEQLKSSLTSKIKEFENEYCNL